MKKDIQKISWFFFISNIYLHFIFTINIDTAAKNANIFMMYLKIKDWKYA